jgi:serine/threonine protein kinase
MDHDFAGLHRIKNTFSLAQLKCIFKQILEGVKYLHDNKIVHRDLKSANLLLNNKGEVNIADFGLARTMSSQPNAKYTYKVVTLWYRAPELLLGQSNYTSQIDMWSIGCIFAELLTGEVLFKGDTEYR